MLSFIIGNPRMRDGGAKGASVEFFQLRYFLEVARQEHVRKGAEALHVSQPAVTKAVHRLEDELGVKLFIPSGRNIRLTTCGRFLYEEISRLKDALDTLPDKVRNLASQESATVHLNIFAAWTLVSEAIIEYQRIDNGLRIKLNQNEHDDMADITVSTVQYYSSRKKEQGSVYV